jgi:hypothetical protein
LTLLRSRRSNPRGFRDDVAGGVSDGPQPTEVGTVDLVDWFLFGQREMQPYPLVDPEQLVSVLPNAPKRGAMYLALAKDPKYDPKWFDKFGYLKGERGTRIAGVQWTKRPVSQDAPYDVDLVITINATTSPQSATEGFAHWLRTNEMLTGEALGMPSSMAADQIDFKRVQPGGKPPFYSITARYGNYVFRFVAEIAAGGYFESEQQLFEQMQTLGAHIRATLEQHAA